MTRSIASAGARRGQPSDDQMSPGSRIQRQVHQVGRPQVLEHEHVGIFAERRARLRQHLVGAAADLTLAHQRTNAIVSDADLAFDRDDVLAPLLVDQIHEGGHERPLAARPRAGDEHQPVSLERERLDLARQTELLDRDAARTHQAEHAPGAA